MEKHISHKSEVKVLPYSYSFPKRFRRIKDMICRAAKRELDIHHIGSTAIPGLSGKGVIDILIGVRNWTEGIQLTRILKTIGFTHAERVRGRIFVSKKAGLKDTHVHIVRKGTKQYSDYLKFRDYLRANGEERKRYQELKNQLVTKFRGDASKYRELKSKYIKFVLRHMTA